MHAITLDKEKSTGYERPSEPAHTGVFQRLIEFVKGRVSVGYEDEDGFHYGVKSAKSNH